MIISYVLLSIVVGCSSTLALKEYWNLYSIFKKYKFGENRCDKIIVNEKVIFYLFPSISAVIIIIINGLIIYLFKKFKDIKSKWLLIGILGIFVLSFVISLFFYCCFSIPILNKEKENKKKVGKR